MPSVCTASRYGSHDYSKMPHNTPDDPRDSEDEGCCFAVAADPFGPCEHDRRFEVVIYQPGTHDWIRAQGCGPCVMTLRERDRHWHWANAPRGIHSIRELGREAVNA
jgi:hypothetical protein